MNNGIVYELEILSKDEYVLQLNGSTLTLKMKKIAVILLVFSPLTAIAETLYVSDTLRVGIRTEPKSNTPSIAVIQSGAAVEVLAHKGSYIQVRTKSGVEGWVKGAYFSSQTPVSEKLDDALAEVSKLEKEIQTLSMQKNAKPTSPDVTNRSKELNDKINSLEKSNQSLTNEIQTLKSQPGHNMENKFSLKSINENTLYIALGILVVLFSLGFLFGVSWHKNQVAKRLGGMSI